MGLVGVGAVALMIYDYTSSPSGDDTVTGDLFTSVDQCAAGGRYDRQECSDAFESANRDHEQTAPRFGSEADCEAEFSAGGCREVAPLPSTGTVANTASFIPVMTGVVIATGIANAISSALPVYRSCSNDPNQNNCRSTGGGGFYTGSGYGFYRSGAGSSVSFSRSAFSPSSSATLARGGFGARALAIAAHIGG